MINIRIFNAHPKYRIRRKGTIEIVRHVLKNESQSSAEVNIIFVEDRRMIGMNKTFLNHGYATDVLSFSLQEHKNKLEGEVYINVDQARRQAGEFLSTLKEEYARLIIHGVLHLIGYRDKTNEQKRRMTGRENRYLSGIFFKRSIIL